MDELLKPKNTHEQTVTEQEKNIQEVFKLCPELESIGTQEQYEKYLETIFPESKMRNIIWHGSKSSDAFGKFNEPTVNMAWGKGIYFRKTFEKLQKDRDQHSFIKSSVPALADVKKPFFPTNVGNEYVGRALYDCVLNDEYNEYVIFNKDNIHILGSKPDLEAFKEFVSR